MGKSDHRSNKNCSYFQITLQHTTIMSTHKTFVLIDANGYIGKHILKNFLSVDMKNVEEVAQVLKNHGNEVVVSAIGGDALDAQQRTLADAAKKAGVRLFIPSEFGIPTGGVSLTPNAHPGSLLVQKDQFAEYLRKNGLPWTRFFVSDIF
ncbi:isoflavone reductase family protein [Moniliophthora roreri]|nr:isoflavone reductase family protein [Moniliophthora roreri]